MSIAYWTTHDLSTAGMRPAESCLSVNPFHYITATDNKAFVKEYDSTFEWSVVWRGRGNK
jgi:hypothetical protein